MQRPTEIIYSESDHSKSKLISGEEILQVERKRYTFLVYSSYMILNFMLAIFVCINLLEGNKTMVFVELGALAFSIIATSLLHIFKKKQFIEYVTLIMLQFLFVFLYFKSPETSIWYLTYPSMGFFILGHKEGLIAAIIAFVILLVISFIPIGSIVLPMEFNFRIRFIFVYITISFMVFLFEHSRHNSSINMLKMADAIKTNEERLKTILTTSQAIIFAINRDGIIDILEGESLKEIGLFSGAYTGKHISEALGDNPDLKRCIESALMGEFIQREIEIKKSIFDFAFSPWRTDSNSVIGVIGMALDITEKKTIQKQLETARKMEAIGKLAGGIAHDFNNMLGAISGYAELIIKKFGDNNDEKLSKYSSKILSAAQHSSDLVYKLLAFSRQKVFQKGPVNLHENIEEVIDLLQDTLGKNISVEKSLNAESSTIIGDRSQIQNALLNLSINARDAMPDGGILSFTSKNFMIDKEYLKTKAYKIPIGEYVQISITDNGTGMSNEVKRKIFEPFFTTKEPGKGTGLGLASVYGTVKSHGGIIEVYSEIGIGTTFNIYLPIKLNHSPYQISEKNYLKSNEIHKGYGKILVIEDEELVRNMLCAILSELGYDPIDFSDPREAIKFYQRSYKEIRLSIVDIVMPHMGGHECFQKLLEIDKDSIVIMASGYAINDEIRSILDAGAKEFIHKPFTLKVISAVLKELLPDN